MLFLAAAVKAGDRIKGEEDSPRGTNDPKPKVPSDTVGTSVKEPAVDFQ